MKNIMKVAVITVLSSVIAASAAVASSANVWPAKDIDFSFEGPFGKFDKAQLQRGFQVYKEVCAACHSLNYVSFRELSDPQGVGFTENEVKSIAAAYTIQDGPNESGEMFERPRRPSDRFAAPFPNKEAAIVANGAYPPDLSLITKARSGWSGTFRQLFSGMGGSEYVYSVLTGYLPEPAEAHDKPEGKHYNPYFKAGPWITMPKPLADDQVTYADGTEATVDQMAKDVSAFLTWTAEPRMVERKETGFRVISFLLILSALLYLSYKKLWRNIDH